MSDHDAITTDRCTWYEQPLPAPIETLPTIHGGGGEILIACSVDCLADLVVVLGGRPRRDTTEARRSLP